MEKQIVTNDLGGAKINENDIKIDTSPENEEEVKNQDEVNKELDIDESETASEVSEDEKEEDDEDDVITNEYDNGLIDMDEEEEIKDEDEDNRVVLTKEEYDKQLQEAKDSTREEAQKEFMDKYKPNEQKKENIKLHKENGELQSKLQQMDTTNYLVMEKQNEIYNKFFDNHKDVLPETSKQALMEYQKTGNTELVLNDSDLQKLDKKLSKIIQLNPKNPLVDLEERLEDAFSLAFRKEISETQSRQSQVKQEMQKQQEDKFVEDGQKSSVSKPIKSLTEEQKKVFDIWGVKPN